MHKVVLDGISYNKSSIVHLGKYGDINAEYPTTMSYYVIRYLAEPYTLQVDQTAYGKVSKADELLVKSEYLSIMKGKILVLSTEQNESEYQNINTYLTGSKQHCTLKSYPRRKTYLDFNRAWRILESWPLKTFHS